MALMDEGLTKMATLEKLRAACKNTLIETLDIEFIDCGDDFLMAKMPVTPKVHQPDGILHGGATAALAETVGSMATHIFMDTEAFFVRGIEVTANHIKSIAEGDVYAKATFLHRGRTTQLLDIKVTDAKGTLISACKLSTITLPKKTD